MIYIPSSLKIWYTNMIYVQVLHSLSTERDVFRLKFIQNLFNRLKVKLYFKRNPKAADYKTVLFRYNLIYMVTAYRNIPNREIEDNNKRLLSHIFQQKNHFLVIKNCTSDNRVKMWRMSLLYDIFFDLTNCENML